MDVTLFTNFLGAIGLGAASGLNAWIPLFGLGLASRLGVVTLTEPFDGIGSTPALIVLGALLVLDLVGDKVPAIDSVLHAFGMVVAPVSGAIVFAAQDNLVSQSHPWLAGALGLTLGGAVHAGRSTVRPAVTAGTGGIGNPVVSTVEDVISTVLTVLAVLVPVLAFLALVGLVVWVAVLFRRWRRRRAQVRAGRVAPVTGPPGTA